MLLLDHISYCFSILLLTNGLADWSFSPYCGADVRQEVGVIKIWGAKEENASSTITLFYIYRQSEYLDHRNEHFSK